LCNNKSIIKINNCSVSLEFFTSFSMICSEILFWPPVISVLSLTDD
jgi:hypothetical protein